MYDFLSHIYYHMYNIDNHTPDKNFCIDKSKIFWYNRTNHVKMQQNAGLHLWQLHKKDVVYETTRSNAPIS